MIVRQINEFTGGMIFHRRE